MQLKRNVFSKNGPDEISIPVMQCRDINDYVARCNPAFDSSITVTRDEAEALYFFFAGKTPKSQTQCDIINSFKCTKNMFIENAVKTIHNEIDNLKAKYDVMCSEIYKEYQTKHAALLKEYQDNVNSLFKQIDELESSAQRV